MEITKQATKDSGVTRVEYIHPSGNVILVVTSPTSYPPYVPPHAHRKARKIFRVSWEAFTLASEYFATQMNESWPEGREFYAKGSVRLDFPETDPDAFRIILFLIHDRPDNTPEVVDIDLLVQVVLLADHYRCFRAVKKRARQWYKTISEDTIPSPQTLTKRVFLSWTLKFQDDFYYSTKIAKRLSEGDFDSLGLPIPAAIAQAITKSRQDILRMLRDYMTTYGEMLVRTSNATNDQHAMTKLFADFLAEAVQFGIEDLLSPLNVKKRSMIEIQRKLHKVLENNNVPGWINMLGIMLDVEFKSQMKGLEYFLYKARRRRG